MSLSVFFMIFRREGKEGTEMFRKSHVLSVVVLAVALLAGSGVEAQTTTGRIIGTVTDEDGQGLPGVTITISSPALIGGPQTRITDSDGGCQFIGLYPGDYTVKADLASFVSQERQQVKVPLGGAAALDIVMPQGRFESEIEVRAETPVVDPTQVDTEQVFDARYLLNAALGSTNRAYQAVLTQAAGVNGGWNPNVLGSTLIENAFYIDGQDTSDPVTATWGTLYNFDSIAEIEFKTSGFEAEFGRATGGIVNVLTKSGGNQFNGTVDIRYRADSFQESGDHFDASSEGSSYQDYGATLGGPILRDKLWFFAAYEYIDSKRTPTNSLTTREFKGTNYNAKLTWQAALSWRMVGKFAGSPADIDNDNASQFVAPEATAFQTQGADVYALELNGVLTERLIWNTVAGAYRGTLDVYPTSRDLETPSHLNFTTFRTTRNYNNQQYSERNREDVATDLTWFVDDFAGSHEFKVGVQYAGTDFRSANCATGTTGGACSPGSVGFFYADVGSEEVPFPYLMWETQTAGAQKYTGRLWTAYFQDSWRPLSNLTLKLGVRQDNVKYDNNENVQIANLGKLQPRVGLAWDVTNDAKNVVRANWGRFMNPASLSLPEVLRSGNEPTFNWMSCMAFGGFLGIDGPESCFAMTSIFGWGYRPDDPDGMDPWGWMLPPSNIFGVDQTQVDPGLDPAYADTWSLSYEREIGPRTSVELSYVDKETRDLFEDTCNGNFPTPSEGAECNHYILGNISGLRRDYRGAILRFETRSFDWLTLLASYTFSKSRGNLEASTGTDSAFDIYPYHWVNRYGYLSDHRLHQFKLNGFIYLKGDWTIGFNGFWASAFVWQLVQSPASDPAIQYGVEFLEPRGSRNGDSSSALDLQLAKGFQLGRMRLVAIGTVYNALSNEYAFTVCQDVIGCGRFATGEYTDWVRPRSYELGFRVEF